MFLYLWLGLGPGEDDRAAPQSTGVDCSEPGRTLEEERIRTVEPGTVYKWSICTWNLCFQYIHSRGCLECMHLHSEACYAEVYVFNCEMVTILFSSRQCTKLFLFWIDQIEVGWILTSSLIFVLSDLLLSQCEVQTGDVW